MNRIFALAVVLGLAACGAPDPGAPVSRLATGVPFADSKPHDWSGPKPAHYAVHGIDVSRWQGEIDWQAVRASGIAFAFIKATEGGDHVDPMFARNWDAARRAGVPRGAYHFYYFCRSAGEQVTWFTRNVPRDRAALPPVLDMEWNHASRTCRHRPAAETVRAEMRTYLAAVSRHYRTRPIVYTTVDFYRDNALWEIEGYEFWLRSVAGHPSETYPGQTWSFWQYTGTGIVPGIEGPTDINAFAGTPARWQSWIAAR